MLPEIVPLGDSHHIHYEDEVILCFKGSVLVGTYDPDSEDLKQFQGKEYTNEALLDKKLKKFFVPYSYEFGHFFTDTLAGILLKLEKNKSIVLVVPPVAPRERNNLTGPIKAISYILDYFSRLGVSLLPVPDAQTDDEIVLVKVANLEFQPRVDLNAWSVKKVRDFCRSLPQISKERINRRVYLSRQETKETLLVPVEELKYSRKHPDYFPINYPRIPNEQKLLELIGSSEFPLPIETIVPENIATFSDQVRILSETDVLISSTSSGLFNMLFMPENSTVIELVTPLTVWDSPRDGYLSSYHNHYSLLSFICGINYIGLPHDRNVEQVIDKLTKYII